MISSKLAALAAAVLLPASLAACSGEVSIGGGYDSDDVADRVQEAQEEATPDLEVSDASCPDDEPEEGAEIECTIAIDGVEAPYTVTFTEVTDDGAKFDIAPAQAIVSVEKTVELIVSEFEKEGFAGVEVDCGDAGVVVDDPGSVFTCDVSQDGSSPITATVTIEDLEGNISFSA